MNEQQVAAAEHAPRARTVPSRRAPSPDSVFRRPSDDPTLGDGAKPATTPSWVPTPTRTDRRVFQAPAMVIGGAGSDQGGTGGLVAAALEALGRRVELVAPGAPGVPVAAASDGGAPRHPIVVYLSAADAVVEPAARSTERTVAAYRPGATIVYDVGAGPELTGAAEDVRAAVEARVADADVVLVTTGGLEWLYPDDEARDVVRRWLGTGPGIAVVSGSDGVSAVNAVGVAATAAAPAGDDDAAHAAFAAGVIDALWKGALLGVGARPDLRTLVSWSLQELIDHGSAAGRIAAGGRTLSREEIDDARGVPQIGASARATD